MPRKKNSLSNSLFSPTKKRSSAKINEKKYFSGSPLSLFSAAKKSVRFNLLQEVEDQESYSTPITRSSTNTQTKTKKYHARKNQRAHASKTPTNKRNIYFKISKKHDNNKKFFEKLKNRLWVGAKSKDELKNYFLELNINPKIMNTFYRQEGKDLIITSFFFKTTNLLDFLVHIIPKPLKKQLLQENNYEILNYFITMQISATTYDYYDENKKTSRINQLKSLICLNADAVSEFFSGASDTVIPEDVKGEYAAALKLLASENESHQSLSPSL